MEIPPKYLICDTRTPKEFQNGTISGYKKRDVISAFQNAIINSKIEEAIHWCVELHVSTYSKDIWKILFDVYFKYIHVNNPKLFFYLLQRKKEYDSIIMFYPKNHHIFCRNNQEIRNLFCDIVSISVLSKKNNIFLDKSLPKVNISKLSKQELMKRKIQDSYEIIHDLGYDDLNNTEILCLNQIFTNLNNHKGTLNNCFYWYLLLEKSTKEKQKLKKKNSESLLKYERVPGNSMLNYVDKNKIPENKHWTHLLWKMFEKIILNNKKDSIFMSKLKNYYNDQFKETKISSLKYLIFMGFILLKTNQVKWNKGLIPQYDLYIQVNCAINLVYFEISDKIMTKFDTFSRDLYIKKYYDIQNKLIGQLDKAPKKVNKDINNIQLNKIITGNPLSKDNDYDQDDFTHIENDNISVDKNQMINTNKTEKDVIDAKEERINKKLFYFNECIIKKRNIKKPIQPQCDTEIMELNIIKKRKS